MFSAISAIATLTAPGTRSRPRAGFDYSSSRRSLAVGVSGRRPTPTTRQSRAGDRHLKFYETGTTSRGCLGTLRLPALKSWRLFPFGHGFHELSRWGRHIASGDRRAVGILSITGLLGTRSLRRTCSGGHQTGIVSAASPPACRAGQRLIVGGSCRSIIAWGELLRHGRLVPSRPRLAIDPQPDPCRDQRVAEEPRLASAEWRGGFPGHRWLPIADVVGVTVGFSLGLWLSRVPPTATGRRRDRQLPHGQLPLRRHRAPSDRRGR